jgi:uncharacterized protein YaaN involved in tellurite resistance
MATTSEKELLETLIKKMGESSALNGGFDKLCLMIEHIQDKQEESGKKLDKVSEALYDPNNGLFSRVKAIETKIDTNIDELEKKVRIVPDVKSEVHDLKKFQQSIEEIAGKQLEELHSLVKLRKNLTNIYWALVFSVVMAVLTTLFNIIKHL